MRFQRSDACYARARVIGVMSIKTMRKTTISTLLLFGVSYSINAKILCPVNKNIEEDMRIEESYLTKERAVESVIYLREILEGGAAYEWFSVPNSMKIVNGYFLKYDYLNETHEELKLEKLDAFCSFMKDEAWWYD